MTFTRPRNLLWAGVLAAPLFVLGTIPSQAGSVGLRPALDKVIAGETMVLKVQEGNSLRTQRRNKARRHHGYRHRQHRHRRSRHRHNDGLGGFFLGLGLGLASPTGPRGRCGYWSDRCVDNWGYGNSNYYGCLRYYGC